MSSPYPQPGLPPVGYTPQYSFWPQYLVPPEALLAPARRAGWALFAVGVAFLVLFALIAVAAGSADDAAYKSVIDQSTTRNPEFANVGVTPQLYREFAVGMCVVFAVGGLLIAGVGLIVRRGSMAAAIIGLILLALPALLIAFLVVGSLVGNPADGVLMLIIMAIPIALLATAAMLLVAAIRNAPRVAQARLQLAMLGQQQQMMQYQQMMPYPGYGYPPPAGGYGAPQPPYPTPPSPAARQDDPPTPPPAGG